MRRPVFLAGLFALTLVASACGNSADDKAPVSSAHSPSIVTSPADATSPEEAPASSPAATQPHRTSPQQPVRDDDPGGHPCTDQNGAPGHLIPGSGGGWVCNITGDAPKADVDRHKGKDDDPGGHPCTDQSGAPGHLIPASGGGWVCEITGNAPRN